MKSLRLGLAALVLLVLLPASPASSTAESTAVCYGTWQVAFSPGLGTASQKSTFTSDGEAGTINCLGAVGGHDVTGAGTFGEEGIIEGTALMGTGSSTISVTIPTTAGPAKLSFPVTMTYGPGVGFKYGDALMGPLTFVFWPYRGDGVTSPVTEIAGVAQGVLKS